MNKFSNAAAVAFGFDFQSNAAIVLMLKNMTKANMVKIEGDKQDIEIMLNNGNTIYSQAKSVVDPDDSSNILQKLKDALKSLNETALSADVENLIYVTNSPNPFNNKQTMYRFHAMVKPLEYNELPDSCKKKIEGIYKTSKFTFDKNNFFIYVIPIYGNDENKYGGVKNEIREFLNTLGLREFGLGNEMLATWQRCFFINSTQCKKTITKSEIIWPLIVKICSINRDDAELADFDEGMIIEITDRYKSIIDTNSETFELLTKVLTDFSTYKMQLSPKTRASEFIALHWENYKDYFDLKNIDSLIFENVVKLTIGKIINKRFQIDRIRKAVNL